MLFVAEYELTWDTLESAMAKRMEWDEAKPDSFRYVGEYIWQDGDPPFRGMVIFEAESVEDMYAFVLHYGPSLVMKVHPATDVVSAIANLNGGSRRARPEPARRSGKSRRGR